MEPIAIVGLSFKLPQGVENESDFWDILEQGKNLMTPWPKSRANVDAFFESHTARRNTVLLHFCVERIDQPALTH